MEHHCILSLDDLNNSELQLLKYLQTWSEALQKKTQILRANLSN